MKRLLIMMMFIILLTGCTSEVKTVEDCLVHYENQKDYCTDQELLNEITDLVERSNYIENEYTVHYVEILSNDAVYITGSQDNELDSNDLESWLLVLEYIDDELEDKDVNIDLVLSDTSTEYILTLKGKEKIGIIVVEIIEEGFSETEITSINALIDATLFTDTRIRYGHNLTGDDISIENNHFIVKSSESEELKYFIDELVKEFPTFELTIE